MRTVLIALILAMSTPMADANDKTRNAATDAAAKMMEDAYYYLGVTYLCQNSIGTSHYHAAKLAVENSALIGGKSSDDAVIIADDFDKRVRKDVTPSKAPDDTKCMDSLLSAQNALKVSQARFRKAAAADK